VFCVECKLVCPSRIAGYPHLDHVHPSQLLVGSSLLSIALTVAVAVSMLPIAVSMLVAMTVRVSTTRLSVPTAAAEATAATALHSLGVASRSSAAGCSVGLGGGLEGSQLGVALFAEGLELAALLVE